MPRVTLIKGLLLNLAGQVEHRSKLYLPEEKAYSQLKELSGQDFGYDVEKWKLWFKNKAEQSFQKALLLLDQNKLDDGEKLLREIVENSKADNSLLFSRASCCLGELLHRVGRQDEAIPFLKKVVLSESDDLCKDVLGFEIQQAKKLLGG